MQIRLYDALSVAGIPAQQIHQLQKLRGAPSSDSSPPRLDLKPDDIAVWANDLETDPQYSRMSRSLDALLQPMFPGQMPMVRRNVFTALFVFNPATPFGLELGPLLEGMIGQKWPLRFGLIPYIGDKPTNVSCFILVVSCIGYSHC